MSLRGYGVCIAAFLPFQSPMLFDMDTGCCLLGNRKRSSFGFKICFVAMIGIGFRAVWSVYVAGV